MAFKMILSIYGGVLYYIDARVEEAFYVLTFAGKGDGGGVKSHADVSSTKLL